MYILTFILIFVVGSIGAALDGDFSGIAAIGKFLFYATVIIGFMWILAACPGLLIFIFAVLLLIGFGLSSNNKV